MRTAEHNWSLWMDTMELFVILGWFDTAIDRVSNSWKDSWHRIRRRYCSLTSRARASLIVQIVDIPDELLLTIYDHLRVADRVCLALTCRTLYHKIGRWALNHPDLTLLIDNGLVKYKDGFPPRTELLRRLEKDHHDRWLHCAACHILHRPSVFPPGRFDYPSYYTPRFLHLPNMRRHGETWTW